MRRPEADAVVWKERQGVEKMASGDLLQWFEIETPEACYLTWQQESGQWAGVEFIGAECYKRRNDAFLARFAQTPQWVVPDLEASQAMIQQVVLSRQRLMASMGLDGPTQAATVSPPLSTRSARLPGMCGSRSSSSIPRTRAR